MGRSLDRPIVASVLVVGPFRFVSQVRADDDDDMRRVVCLLVLIAVLSMVGAPGSAASSSEEERPTTTEQPPAPNIIPRPNQGVAPQDAGDRGGALQTVVFVVIVAGALLMVGLVVRSSRRARAERGF